MIYRGMSVLTRVVGVLAALMVVGVGLGFPPSSVAGDIAASQFFPVFGPRLSGETVLWTVPRKDQGYVMKRGRPSSRQAETILTARSQRNRRVALRWVASDREVLVQQALVDTTGDDLAGGLAIDLGTSRLLPGGRLERLAPGAFPNVGNFDLDASVGLFPGEEPGSAVLRDFSDPASSAMRIDGAGSALNVAGRYVAWITEGEVVVYDYVTMNELYSFPRPAGGGLGDLQSDGKVAVTYRADNQPPGQHGLGWASPSEPFLHTLPVELAPVYSLQLSNDILVFERNRDSLASTARGQLGYVPLAGSEKVLARSVETNAGGGDDLFDFDGQRVAWLDRTCAGARVRVETLADLIATPRPAPSRRCRLRLAGRPRLTRAGDLRFRASCGGFRRDCRVLGATIRLARTYSTGGKRLRRGARLFAKRRGMGLSSVGRFRISLQTRRLLRRAKPVRLRVTVRIGDSETSARRSATFAVR